MERKIKSMFPIRGRFLLVETGGDWGIPRMEKIVLT